MSNNRKFCKRYQMEKSVTFLFMMDVFGMTLYIGNILGLVFGNSGSSAGLYLDTVINKTPVIVDLNTIVLLISSFIISFVSIPRFFGFLFVKERPLEYHRRNNYYWIRAVTCGLLIANQIVLFITLIVCIGKQIQNFKGTNDTLMYQKLVPMTVVYGSTLVITIILDAYWTIEVYHYAMEGMALSRKHMLVAQNSLNTSQINMNNTSVMT